ncbi:MAG: PQQ-binding-like beta-propeller repeat protein [Polyangia bacterium]
MTRRPSPRAIAALQASALSLSLLTAACGSAEVEPAFPEGTNGVEIMRLRWVKHLAPELPNFMIPEMMEKYDRFQPVETSTAGWDTDLRRAFIGASVGGLYCLDLREGETVWRYDLDDPVGSRPLYDPDRKWVYFGADDGFLYALHARSGRLIWRADTGAEIRRAIYLHEGTLYLVNAGGMVFAVDPENGDILWRYRRPPMGGFSSVGCADVVLRGSVVYTSFADGVFVALDAVSGAERWTVDLAEEVVIATREGDVNLVDADATPVLVGDTAVGASVSGGVYGLEAETGTVLWTRPDLTGVTGMESMGKTVYAARTGFGLTAIDASSGVTRWQRRFGIGVLQDPLLYDDVLLIADSEAGLLAVSTADGRVMQRLDPQQGFFARPSYKAGYLLALGNGGTLFAMSIH